MTPRTDKAEIVRAMTLLHPAGAVVEVRAIDAETPGDRRPHTASGYFNDFQKMAAEVATIQRAGGIYFTLNTANPALLARACNRLRSGRSKKEPTTSDHDIQARRWLMIDSDPERPAEISSTDVEHDAALAMARSIEAALTTLGWPRPISADSGNGAHLLYQIDLPTNDGGLVERVLKALAVKFNSGGIKVDESVFNPARICKLYGTVAGKGDSIPDRPHRLSKILDVPDEMKVVPKELLEAMAATLSTNVDKSKPKSEPMGSLSQNRTDWIVDFIRQYNLEVDGPEPWQGGGRRWIFRVCPFNPDHTDRSAGIFQHAGGAVSFKCHHNGCAGNDWAALRNKVDPGWQERKATAQVAQLDDAQPDVGDIPPDISDDESGVQDCTDEPEPAPVPPPFKMLAECLLNPALRKRVRRVQTYFPELDAALKGGLMPGGFYVFAGATGGGKSTLGDNVARRMALNGVKTLLLTLEMPETQIVRCLLAASARVPVIDIENLRFNESQKDALREARTSLDDIPLAIDESTCRLDAVCLTIAAAAAQGFKVVVIDQMSWLVTEGQTPFERAATISRRIKAAAKEAGIVLILLVQANREGSRREDGPQLYDLRDSGTIEQDADGVVMIRKVERFMDSRPAHMSLAVLKHRHGPQGDHVRASLSWYLDQARIETYNPADITGVQ